MSATPDLFTPLPLGDITLPNRIIVSPMCMYSSEDGFATDFHLVHLGSRTIGGAGLVLTEATAVTPEGRISPRDLGLWKDAHRAKLRQIADFVHSQNGLIGTQLAHAGRKASMSPPWMGEKRIPASEGGWDDVVAPSAVPFSDAYPTPHELDRAGITRIQEAFVAATRRAREIGFDVIEIHGAHGYLAHEFLSPISNRRTDEYGGSLENRMRFLLETVEAVRGEWPKGRPLLVRISATDWIDGAWDVAQSIELAKKLKAAGVDLVDCSSAGVAPGVKIPIGPGYQTPFAQMIRYEAEVPTGAVGMITDAAQADHIIRTGQADAVLIAREFLRDPYFAVHAAAQLGKQTSWPVQYLRAAPAGSTPR